MKSSISYFRFFFILLFLNSFILVEFKGNFIFHIYTCPHEPPKSQLLPTTNLNNLSSALWFVSAFRRLVHYHVCGHGVSLTKFNVSPTCSTAPTINNILVLGHVLVVSFNNFSKDAPAFFAVFCFKLVSTFTNAN